MPGPLIGIAFAAWLAAGVSPVDHRSMTAEQLRTLLVEAAHESDAAAAEKIRASHLSERLTPTPLTRIEEPLHPGPLTREVLRLAADLSAFLDPPAAEIPAQAPPGSQ